MKRSVAAICAILLGIVFLVSGGWKVLSPFKTGELLEQAQVPGGYGPLGAATLAHWNCLRHSCCSIHDFDAGAGGSAPR